LFTLHGTINFCTNLYSTLFTISGSEKITIEKCTHTHTHTHTHWTSYNNTQKNTMLQTCTNTYTTIDNSDNVTSIAFHMSGRLSLITK